MVIFLTLFALTNPFWLSPALQDKTISQDNQPSPSLSHWQPHRQMKYHRCTRALVLPVATLSHVNYWTQPLSNPHPLILAFDCRYRQSTESFHVVSRMRVYWLAPRSYRQEWTRWPLSLMDSFLSLISSIKYNFPPYDHILWRCCGCRSVLLLLHILTELAANFNKRIVASLVVQSEFASFSKAVLFFCHENVTEEWSIFHQNSHIWWW